jgi:hypothetical protein
MKTMIGAVVAVLALAACGGPEVTRKTVAWNMDAAGGVVCPGADWQHDWTDDHQRVACRWFCVGDYAGKTDQDVILIVQRASDGMWTEAPGAGTQPGCR